MRSYGLLTNAYTISSDEAFSLASDVLLGISLGIINTVTMSKLSETLFATLPASLGIKDKNAEADPLSRDIFRAKYFKDNLLL